MSRLPQAARLDEVVPARRPWSALLKKGEVLRIIDLEGQQAVDTLLYDAHDTSVRYDAQATIVAQNSAYITKGSSLISTDGDVLARVVADTCGRHDTSAGACSCEANTVRFGHNTRYMHACRENFVIEAAKWNLQKRDIVSNINFFMNVPILPNGDLSIDDGISAPGSYVELQAERDVIVMISNCPQVNNPCNGFDPTPIGVRIWAAEEA